MGKHSRTIDRRTFTIAAGGAAIAAVPAARALAQSASPVVGPTGTVVAEGLWNPRFLAFTDDGSLYVTEVGVGGDEVFTFGPPEATPVDAAEATPASGPPATRGTTGQVSVVAPDGTLSVVVGGLPSYSAGVGPCGICVQDGTVYFTVGGTAVLAQQTPLDGENTLQKIDLAAGTASIVAEFNTYEIENNPDGTDINPNLYSVSVGDSDGRLTVNDAGSNTIFSVDGATGEFTLRGIVPDLNTLTANSDTPHTDDPARQPVPTGGVYKGTTYYTAILSEGWPVDGPSILKVDGDGLFATFTSVAAGLSMVTGTAVGPDGNIYFVQLFDDLASGAPIGSVNRLNLADGTHEAVVPGLTMPHGITFDGDGNLYVTTQVLMSAPGVAMGQIMRFDGIGAPTA